MILQRLQPAQYDEAARLIHSSLDHYYQRKFNDSRFAGEWQNFRFFTEIYEALDPGCCVVSLDDDGTMLGCAFYHLRESHCGVGIVATHPTAGGRGVGKAIMQEIKRIAGDQPLRLVSSAFNLDSFSLYTKLGFVPHTTFQDLILAVPQEGLPGNSSPVRAAGLDDIAAMEALELRLNGIRRSKDYTFFLQNPHHWAVQIITNSAGELLGFLCACLHPGCSMIGPGVSGDESTAMKLMHAMLDGHFRGRNALWLVPVSCQHLVQQAYQWGARNVELHLASTLGECPPPQGITIPTFMPESG